MSNLTLAPFGSDIENTTHDLARLEALYAENRELESGIENKISEIDLMATGEVRSAEEELQETNLKCATIFARIERAVGGTLLVIVCAKCI
jgi:GH35 family endo-1,4-beta-xylanase